MTYTVSSGTLNLTQPSTRDETETTICLADFVNVACTVWSKITSWARDINRRDRDISLPRLRCCHFLSRRDVGWCVSKPRRRDGDHISDSCMLCCHCSGESHCSVTVTECWIDREQSADQEFTCSFCLLSNRLTAGHQLVRGGENSALFGDD